MRSELEHWLALLALRRERIHVTERRLLAPLLALHLAGITALWLLLQVPLLWSPLLAGSSLVALLSPQLIDSLRSRQLRLQIGALAPLLLVYIVIALRLCLKYGLGWALPTYAGGEPLNIGAALLTTQNILLAAFAYSVLINIALYTQDRAQFARVTAVLLGALTFGWASWEYLGYRTAGVTGSDPYAYAQMAWDWAERGTPLHNFPLFGMMVALDVPYFGAVHVGYHLPLQNLRDAASVWPTGLSLLLALAFRALGETGIYLVAPVCGLLSLALLWLAARRSEQPYAALVAALATLLLASSFEQVNRLLIPMADVPSQFFSLAAVALAFGAPAVAGRSLALLVVLGSLAGVAFGLAYWIRHTQLLLGIALVLAVILWNKRKQTERAVFIAALALGALLTAIPDLLYHQQVFGGILKVESEELQYFNIDAIGSSFASILREFALPHEFGYIWPLTMLGAWQMSRAQPRLFPVLSSWLLAVLAVHLPYPALRLRDLLGEFPPLVWWTGWGAASLLIDAANDAKWTSPRYRLARAAAILAVVLLLALRTQSTLARTLSAHTAGFGYMQAAERSAFDEVAQLTPANGVIATSLSSGAIDLYAQRLTVRPSVWSIEQFDRVFDALRRGSRPVYLLYDSPDLRPLRDRLLASGRLTPVRRFVVLTFFGERDADAGTLYEIGPSVSSQ